MWIYILAAVLVIIIVYAFNKCCLQKPGSLKTVLGKHVVITGGSSGIGLSFAKIAVKAGAGRVTIIARDENRLKKAVDELEAMKSENQYVEYIKADLAKTVEAKAALLKCDAVPIYMLVNCVGMAICGTLEDMTEDDIKLLIDVNYCAVVNTLKSIIKPMKERKSGIIVITGSQASLFGMYGYSIYASMKFAIRGLAEALSMELKDYNISVTLSLPPDTDTPGFENENKSKPKETQLISNAGGLFQPNDVADKMYKDAMKGNFFSTVGFESWILTTLCVGMTPFTNIVDLFVQALVLGPLRLISAYYLNMFNNTVTRCYQEKQKNST